MNHDDDAYVPNDDEEREEIRKAMAEILNSDIGSRLHAALDEYDKAMEEYLRAAEEARKARAIKWAVWSSLVAVLLVAYLVVLLT